MDIEVFLESTLKKKTLVIEIGRISHFLSDWF